MENNGSGHHSDLAVVGVVVSSEHIESALSTLHSSHGDAIGAPKVCHSHCYTYLRIDTQIQWTKCTCALLLWYCTTNIIYYTTNIIFKPLVHKTNTVMWQKTLVGRIGYSNQQKVYIQVVMTHHYGTWCVQDCSKLFYYPPVTLS